LLNLSSEDCRYDKKTFCAFGMRIDYFAWQNNLFGARVRTSTTSPPLAKYELSLAGVARARGNSSTMGLPCESHFELKAYLWRIRTLDSSL